MKKRLIRKSFRAAPQDEPGVADLINKIGLRLCAVEEKLDVLINQSSKRPFEKSYSQKPFRRFDHSQRYDRPRQDNGPRERTYTQVICADCNKECEIPFKPSGDRPVYCRECFPKHKKGNSFNTNRNTRFEERGFSRERRFDKRHAKNSQKPDKKKGSFFQHKKKTQKLERR